MFKCQLLLKSLHILKNPCVPCVRKICQSINTVSLQKSLLKPEPFFILSKRHFEREINPDVERSLKISDKIPENYSIIYRAPLLWYVKLTYSVAFGSFLFLPSIISWCYVTQGLVGFPLYLDDFVLVSDMTEFLGLVGAMAFVIFQVSYVVFKYPLRIYADRERNNYIVVYQHIFPWWNKNHSFAKNSSIKKIKSILPWKDALYNVGNRQVILIENSFIRPSELNRLVGHDEQEN